MWFYPLNKKNCFHRAWGKWHHSVPNPSRFLSSQFWWHTSSRHHRWGSRCRWLLRRWRGRHNHHRHRWWYSYHCEYYQWFIVLLLVLRLYDKYLYHSPNRSRLSDPTSDQNQKVEAGIHVHRLLRLKTSWSSKCMTKYLYTTSTHPRVKSVKSEGCETGDVETLSW